MTKTKSPGCDHCSHPLFAGIKCGVCGWTCEPDDDSGLRAKVEDSQAAANKFANLQQADEALMRQALEALVGQRYTACGWRSDCDKAITVLRKRLEGKK